MKKSCNNNRIARLIESDKKMQRKFGSRISEAVRQRLALLETVANLDEVPAMGKVHSRPLTGDRKGQFAVGLGGRHRLVIEIGIDPVPQFANGGIVFSAVTHLTILEIADYY